MANEFSKQILEYLRNLYGLVDRLEIILRDFKTLTDVQSWITSRFDKSVDYIEAQLPIDDVLRELSGYITEKFDKIDEKFDKIDEKFDIIIDRLDRLSGKETPSKDTPEPIKVNTSEFNQDINRKKLESIRYQLKSHHKNKNELENRAALYSVNVPPEIRNQIDWEIKEIARLEENLEKVRRQINDETTSQ